MHLAICKKLDVPRCTTKMVHCTHSTMSLVRDMSYGGWTCLSKRRVAYAVGVAYGWEAYLFVIAHEKAIFKPFIRSFAHPTQQPIQEEEEDRQPEEERRRTQSNDAGGGETTATQRAEEDVMRCVPPPLFMSPSLLLLRRHRSSSDCRSSSSSWMGC
ncbi:hypothetical protein Q3G72_010280 [Acer saccharum]|nr:hypothetical protein Q3G72_010280 [Acer saccharum]